MAAESIWSGFEFTTHAEFRDRVKHPYIPRSLVLDGYVPQTLRWEQILGGFGIACAVVAVACIILLRRCHHLSSSDRWLFVWFVVSGLIHLVIEGTFAAWTEYYKDTTGNFLAEIWKEYSKADSRYASYDPFVTSMETITAFIDGPLCLLTAYAMFTDSAIRYPVQLIVSVMQLYGDVLYYWTAILDGTDKYCVPTDLHYWVYFIFMNSLWIVIPLICIWNAVANIVRAMQVLKPLKGVIPNGKAQPVQHTPPHSAKKLR